MHVEILVLGDRQVNGQNTARAWLACRILYSLFVDVSLSVSLVGIVGLGVGWLPAFYFCMKRPRGMLSIGIHSSAGRTDSFRNSRDQWLRGVFDRLTSVERKLGPHPACSNVHQGAQHGRQSQDRHSE